jgi:sulfate/thiosulfate transport system substrate-binding protein
MADKIQVKKQIIFLLTAATFSALSCKSKDVSESANGVASEANPQTQKKKARVLTLGAYTTPREVYGKKIIPAFKAFWKEKTGENIEIRESYLGSGAQSRAIAGGFEADIAALSLEPDIERLVKAGLVDKGWKAGPSKGMVTRSVVVFGVRKQNPLKVATWDDLAAAGRKVLTPNVKTSGGAMWNIAALYGAAMRGRTSAAEGDEAQAEALLSRVLANVEIMDKGARESMLTFENGVGEIIITYENEMRVAAKMGKDNEYVIPPSTILIENPIAVVDKYAKEHGVVDAAEGFVSFVRRPEIQKYFAEYGLRPVDESAAAELLKDYPPIKDLFTVRDFGNWQSLTPKLFGRGGFYDRAMAKAGEAK